MRIRVKIEAGARRRLADDDRVRTAGEDSGEDTGEDRFAPLGSTIVELRLARLKFWG